MKFRKKSSQRAGRQPSLSDLPSLGTCTAWKPGVAVFCRHPRRWTQRCIQVATSALWCRGEAEFLPAARLGLDLSRAKVPSYGNSTATETSKIRRGLAAPNRLALWKLAPRPGLEPGTYGLTVEIYRIFWDFLGFLGTSKTITYQ
jgi:hypothetical protein